MLQKEGHSVADQLLDGKKLRDNVSLQDLVDFLEACIVELGLDDGLKDIVQHTISITKQAIEVGQCRLILQQSKIRAAESGEWRGMLRMLLKILCTRCGNPLSHTNGSGPLCKNFQLRHSRKNACPFHHPAGAKKRPDGYVHKRRKLMQDAELERGGTSQEQGAPQQPGSPFIADMDSMDFDRLIEDGVFDDVDDDDEALPEGFFDDIDVRVI